MNAAFILSRFEAVKPTGEDKWMVRCPAHADTAASLSITAKADKILLHCHAGCSFHAIIDAAGLKPQDLFDDGDKPKALPARTGGLGEIVKTYDYTDADGNLLFQVCRFQPKDFRQRKPDGAGGWTWKLGDTPRVLYRLPEVMAAAASGMIVFIVEGEKDADALAALGLVATTSPGGAGKWKASYSDSLTGAAVCIIPDADAPGRAHAEQVAASVKGKAASVAVLTLAGLPDKGDVSDWLAAGGGPEELTRLALEAPEWTPEDAPTAPPQPSEGATVLRMAPPQDEAIAASLPIPATDINQYNATDSGNGELFAALYGARVKHQKRGADLVFEGHVWREPADGEMDQLAKELARVRALAAYCVPDLNQRRHLTNWAIKSEQQAGKRNTIEAARATPPIADDNQPWDADQNLSGAPNGIVNLKEGTIRPGKPEDKITKSLAIPYDPDAPCPRWDRFMDEVFGGDNDLIDFIQRSMGYSLTGHTSEQCLWILYGRGSNGKSKLITVMRDILGPYQLKMPFAMFESSPKIGGEKASPDVAALAGCRLVTSGEVNAGVKLDSAKLKELTGADAVTSRHLRQEYFTFIPTCKIWLMVNHKPVIKDDSFGFWRRVRIIPFLKEFDPHLEPTLEATLRSEYPGILAWMVRGAMEWYRSGLATPPACVLEATKDYKTESDTLAEWKQECLIEAAGNMTSAKIAYASYTVWAEREKLSPRETLSKIGFGRKLSASYSSKHTMRGEVYLGFAIAGQEQLDLGLEHKTT